MDHDSTDHPKPPAPRKARRGSERDFSPQDLPPQDLALASGDVDPATASAAEEDEESRLPEEPEEHAEAIAEGTLKFPSFVKLSQ